MGGNGEPLAHGRIWSGPLKLLLPALSDGSLIRDEMLWAGYLGAGFGSAKDTVGTDGMSQTTT